MSSKVWEGGRKRIYMQEVGPRDGLQIEEAFVPTEQKIALVDALSDSGLAKIEVTAFVSPQAIPALRDADWVGEAVVHQVEGLRPAFAALAFLGWEREHLPIKTFEGMEFVRDGGVPEGEVFGG